MDCQGQSLLIGLRGCCSFACLLVIEFHQMSQLNLVRLVAACRQLLRVRIIWMGRWSTMRTICTGTTLQWPPGRLSRVSTLTGAPSH